MFPLNLGFHVSYVRTKTQINKHKNIYYLNLNSQFQKRHNQQLSFWLVQNLNAILYL